MNIKINNKGTYNKDYYLKNRDSFLNSSRKSHSKNRVTTLLISSRREAKRKGLEFNLEREDIQIPQTCKYLGVPLTSLQGKGKQDFNSSVDRIDSSKGYIKGNIQVISFLANRMKNSSTQEQLLAFAKNIIKEHEGK